MLGEVGEDGGSAAVEAPLVASILLDETGVRLPDLLEDLPGDGASLRIGDKYWLLGTGVAYQKASDWRLVRNAAALEDRIVQRTLVDPT